MLEATEYIQTKLARLSIDFTELSNKTLPFLPSRVGSVAHHNFLQQESLKDPLLCSVSQSLSTRNHATFSSKAKRMVNLARECNQAGVIPDPYLPKPVQGKKISMAENLKASFSSNNLAPHCPHVQAEFEWYDHQRRPLPGIIKLRSHRFLLSSLVTRKDLKYTWMTKKWMQVTIRYSDMMNFPIELVDLVTDDEGNPVFHEQHQCVQGFEKDLARRREADGYVYEVFDLHFEKDQDQGLVRINSKLSGFDVLRAKYVNSENELCHFKMLQIITKEYDEDENREGEATYNDCTTIMKSRPAVPQRQTNSPFSLPVVSSPAQPTPTHVGSAPTPMRVDSMPAGSHPQDIHDKQVMELQFQLQKALNLASENEATARRVEMDRQRMQTEVERANKSAAEQYAVAQVAQAAANEATAQRQAAQAAANEATAQRQATTNEAHAAIAQTRQEQQIAANAAHAAIAQTGTQQEAIFRMQAELDAAKAAAAQQQHAALEQQRLEHEAVQVAAAQQHGIPAAQQQVAQTELAQRTAIQNAKGNLAKRARSTSSNEDDRARFGLHGSDGQNNPGVPQYVDPQEQSADMHDDLSGFDSVFS
jgi:hypothetical protein